MSSRQEEKERRKAERAEAEAKAARAAATKGRLQLALGGLVAVAAIVVAVLVFSSSGGGGDETVAPPSDVALPAQKETNLETAAEAAGCTLTTPPAEGRGHTTKEVAYKTNPPTSGDHNPTWSEDGIYASDNTPPIGMLVHSLEHGRVNIQYKPGTPAPMVEKIEALGSEELRFGRDAYHTLVYQNATEMDAAIAATAWTQSLTCPEMNDGVYDAVRAFRVAYTDKGPELIP